MKKYLYLILVLLIIPFTVYAEECNDTKVIIKDITIKKSIGNTEEIEQATITNNKINLNIKMYEVGDSIEYTFKVINDSDEDYYIDNSINERHIEYIITSDDNSFKIPIGEEKEFKLTATYKEELEKTDFKAGKYDASSLINLNVIPDSIYNPKTGSPFYTFLTLLIIVICAMLFTLYKKSRIAILLFTCVFLIPYTSHASCKVNLELNSNIIVGHVVPNPCTYDGNLVQGAEYTNGQYTYRYMQESTDYSWNNINNDGWGVTLTDKESTDPVTTTLCTSINDKEIVSMKGMFYNSQTTSIDTSSFDTSNVTNMYRMFDLSVGMAEIDVSQFDTSKVTNMAYMFNHCSNLKEIEISNFDISNVTDMTGFIANCSSLKKINLDNLNLEGISSNNTITSNIIVSNDYLEEVSFKNWKIPSTFTDAIGCFQKFGICSSKLEYLDVTGWDLSNTTNVSGLFNGYNGKEIRGLDTWDTSNITNMDMMFYSNSYLVKLDLSKFNTSNVTSINGMIQNCSNLEELNISNFDLSNGTSFSSFANGIFRGTSSLKKINMSNMKLPPDMSNSIFRYSGAYSSPIEEIDVTNWNLSDTTNLFGVFGNNGSNGMGGTGLKRIVGLETWDTSNITNMSNMFYGLNSIEQLDLSSFDISNVTDISLMFYNCSNLEEIDVSSFDTRNVTNMSNMFQSDTQLKTIYIGDGFVTSNVSLSSNMFNGCTSLIGGNGTTYNSSYTDKTYARIDQAGRPGYFTKKATS